MTALEPASARIAGLLSSSLIGEQPRRLLVVDDEDSIRIAISRFLRSRGYEVEEAESGARAIELLKQRRFDALLCDVRMPGMAGTEVIPRALELWPDLVILMLTAVSDAPTVTEVLALGAMDYLMKPVDLADLAGAVDRAVSRREGEIRQRLVERLLREEVARGTEQLRRDQQALVAVSVGLVRSLVEACEGKDKFLRGNSHRVAEIAVEVGRAMRLSDDEVGRLRMAGELHDVGNIGIPEVVLGKPGPLTPEERACMQEHVRIGVTVLRPLEALSLVLPAVQDHHERWDGGGYPRALAGEQISLGGRILAAADAFVAMTSRRAHREPVMVDLAVRRLSAVAGGQLDPEVFSALRDCSAISR